MSRTLKVSRLRLRLRLRLRFAAGFCVLGLVLGACTEIDARRKIQEADKLYRSGGGDKKCEDGNTLCSEDKHCAGIKGGTCRSKMLDTYEDALKIQPGLSVGHHNAGLAYMKMHKRQGSETEKRAYADGAARHFEAYLEKHPEDGKVRQLLTSVWLQSDQFEVARDYWMKELAIEPENLEVLVMLASIDYQRGAWKESVRWNLKIAELEPEPEAKVASFLNIAKLTWGRLRHDKAVGPDRIEVADVGIAALQRAAAIDPPEASIGENEGKKTPLSVETKMSIQSYLATHYSFRAAVHGASWARNVDTASQQNHTMLRTELGKIVDKNRKAAKEASDQAAAAAGKTEDKSDG